MELGSIFFLSQQYTLYHNWSISCLSGFSQTAIKTPVSTHVTQVKYIAVLAAHSQRLYVSLNFHGFPILFHFHCENTIIIIPGGLLAMKYRIKVS